MHQLEAKNQQNGLQIKEYVEELQININTIQTNTIQDLKILSKSMIAIYGTQTCKKKSTLTIYRKSKHIIKDGHNLYDNSAARY